MVLIMAVSLFGGPSAYGADAQALSRRFSGRSSAPANLLGRFFLAVQVSKERRALAQMSPQQLEDLGLSSEEAQAEAARGFWDLPLDR